MMLDLANVKEIATEVARTEDPRLEVVAASTTEGGSSYAEVTVSINGCREEPCRIIVGVNRSGDDRTVRDAFASRLREHLTQHRG